MKSGNNSGFAASHARVGLADTNLSRLGVFVINLRTGKSATKQRHLELAWVDLLSRDPDDDESFYEAQEVYVQAVRECAKEFGVKCAEETVLGVIVQLAEQAGEWNQAVVDDALANVRAFAAGPRHA